MASLLTAWSKHSSRLHSDPSFVACAAPSSLTLPPALHKMTGLHPQASSPGASNAPAEGTITVTMPPVLSPEMHASLTAMRSSQPPPVSSTSNSSSLQGPSMPSTGDTRALQPLRPPHKRMRSEAPDSPSRTTVTITPAVPAGEPQGEPLGSSRRSRDLLFDSVVANNAPAEFLRTIQSPDDLGKAQLLRLFEILHGCGRATVPDASLAVTRKSIEGFLDAIFNGWTTDQDRELARPVPEFRADAEVPAGHVCGLPDEHIDASSCTASSECTVFSAVATYCTDPPTLKMEFVAKKQPGQAEGDGPATLLSPLARRDLRWLETDWPRELQAELKRRILGRLHKHNKHVALWKARTMVQAWIRGDVGETGEAGCGFLTPRDADAAMMGFARAA